MKWFFRISAGLLVVDLALLTGWIAIRLGCNPSSFSTVEITPWIVAAGVLVALVTLSINQCREASEEYLESATDLLAKAYGILEASKDDQGRPRNSRLNWLTSARLIRTAENIAALVSMESHQRIWREKKEYWRGRLRDLIKPEKNEFPMEYFAEKPEHMIAYSEKDRAPLSQKSLAVLYRFVEWPSDVEDPLKNEKSFTKEEIDNMTRLGPARFGPRGLGKLLEEVEKIKTGQKEWME